jgi:hypothetical protein
VKLSLNSVAMRCKRLAPLLAAPAALLLSQGQAKAILNINIFDDGPNLKVTVNGSISPGNAGTSTAADSNCFGSGSLSGQGNASDPSTLCTGTDAVSSFRDITGPNGFGGNGLLFPASSVTGFSFQFYPLSYNTGTSFNSTFDQYKSTYALDPSYVLGQIFSSSATFNGKSLASEGFTATGLVGTWTIDGTSESINVYIGPAAATPGPLPLLGAGAAFGWSRRLRKRTAAPLITPPQA